MVSFKIRPLYHRRRVPSTVEQAECVAQRGWTLSIRAKYFVLSWMEPRILILSGRSSLGVSAGVRLIESVAGPRWRQPPRSLSVSLSVSLMELLRLPDYQVSSTSTTGDNKFPVTSTTSSSPPPPNKGFVAQTKGKNRTSK